MSALGSFLRDPEQWDSCVILEQSERHAVGLYMRRASRCEDLARAIARVRPCIASTSASEMLHVGAMHWLRTALLTALAGMGCDVGLGEPSSPLLAEELRRGRTAARSAEGSAAQAADGASADGTPAAVRRADEMLRSARVAGERTSYFTRSQPSRVEPKSAPPGRDEPNWDPPGRDDLGPDQPSRDDLGQDQPSRNAQDPPGRDPLGRDTQDPLGRAGLVLPDARLAKVAAGDMCVTRGELAKSRVDVPTFRAVARSAGGDAASMRFVAQGKTDKLRALASGQKRRQLGLKLRAQDGCNLVYVMWRLDPKPKLDVSVKRNPGKRTHDQCGAGGYTKVRPKKSIAVPALLDGDEHELRAEIRGDELVAWIDDKVVFEGKLPASARGLAGPAGMRSDNLAFELRDFEAEGTDSSGNVDATCVDKASD